MKKIFMLIMLTLSIGSASACQLYDSKDDDIVLSDGSVYTVTSVCIYSFSVMTSYWSAMYASEQ